MEELVEIQIVDKETVLSYADWIFPRYYGDTNWGRSPGFHCHECLRQYGYAIPSDGLFLRKRKNVNVLICKNHVIKAVEQNRRKR